MTIREDGLSHIPFHPFSQKAAPAGQIYPPPSARPFFKGLLYWHAKTESAREISIVRNTRIPLSPHKSITRVGKVASAARRIGCWQYDNEREKASQISEMRTPLPSHSLSSRFGSQPPPLRGTSFQRKEVECRPPPPLIVISSECEKSFSFAVKQK